MSDVRHFDCNLCDALCGMNVTVEGGRVTGIRGDPEDVHSRGHICPKGPAMRDLLEDPDRLRTPVRRTATGWEPIGWDEALGEAAGRLRAIQRAHGKDAVGLYVGNPTVHSHRAALGSELLTAALGTRNRFDPGTQDSAPRLFACREVYGDVTSIPVPDLDRTDHLLILGANPAVSNGSMMALGDARGRLAGVRARGGRLVVVDPRRTETAALADAHHFIRPGGDAALLFAMLHVLFEEGLVDEARVASMASGLGVLRELSGRFPPSRVAAAIGIEAEAIRGLARELAGARRAVVHGRIGTCQNELGPIASWLIEIVNVVTGNFDREGGAMFATPAADVARLARMLLGGHAGVRHRSRVRGLPELLGTLPSAAMAEEMETPGAGQIRGFVTFAGNPVLSTPNSARLSRALAGLDFMVSIDFYVNETSRHAHLVLPPAHPFEVGNYELILLGLAVHNVARYSPPILDRPAGARDDWEILSELSARLVAPGGIARAARRLGRGFPDRAVDLLLRLGPHRLTLDALRRAPHGVDLGPLQPSRADKVRTPDGRVRLAPEVFVREVPRLERWVAERAAASASGGELVLIGRRHLLRNNSWMHNARSLVKGPDRSQLLMHPADAARLGLAGGMRVRVRSRVGEVTATLAVTEDLKPGVVSLPHGFGHAEAAATLRVAGAVTGPNVNELTDDQRLEPLVGAAILSGVPVSVSPVGSGG